METSLLLIPVPRILFGFLLFRFYYYELGMSPSPAATTTTTTFTNTTTNTTIITTATASDGVSLEFALTLAATFATNEMVMLVWICLLKWILIGRIPSGTQRNLWSPFVRRWQMAYSSLGRYFWTCPIMPEWSGYNAYARLFGINIGARVVGLNSYCFIDPDMWHIGDDVQLNSMHPQAHTFEDHNLDLGKFELEEGVSVLPLAMVMQNIKVGKRSIVGPLACVMKSSELDEFGYYDGVPCRRVGDLDVEKEDESCPLWAGLPSFHESFHSINNLGPIGEEPTQELVVMDSVGHPLQAVTSSKYIRETERNAIRTTLSSYIEATESWRSWTTDITVPDNSDENFEADFNAEGVAAHGLRVLPSAEFGLFNLAEEDISMHPNAVNRSFNVGPKLT